MQIYLTFLTVTYYLFSTENVFPNIHGMNNFYWTTVFNFFPVFSSSSFFFWTLYKLLFIIFVQSMRFQRKVVQNRDPGKPGFKGVSLNNVGGVINVKEKKLSGHQCGGGGCNYPCPRQKRRGSLGFFFLCILWF